MTESVELRTESTIPELEEMVKHQLFEESEIKIIAKKRQEFEYRLHRHTKNKEDCIRYIQYEFHVLKLIRARRQKCGLAQKKMNVEYTIANRLNKLFNEAIRKYQDDIRIWLSYIKFCQQVKFYTSASRVFYQLLELHGKDKPKLFKLASNWEFEECKSIEKARKYLLAGLHIHKDSHLLFKESFKLELHYANEKRNEAKKDENADLSEPVYQGQHAKIIYRSAVKKLGEASFLVEMLEIAKQYDFTQNLQDTILADLKSKFPCDELTWDAVAKNKLTDTKSKEPLRERIRECVDVYKIYVKKLKTEKMWSLYIDALIEFRKSKPSVPKLKRQLLMRALNSGHKAGKLREKYYFVWFDMLKGMPTKEVKVKTMLQEATDRLSSSLLLWELRLQFYMSRGETDLAEAAFKQANESLGPNALPLWKLMLLYYQAKTIPKVEELLTEGINSNWPDIANPLKVMYLERLAVTKGINATRKAYDHLASIPPFYQELHTKMASIEIFQTEINLKHARACYTLACKQFGNHNTDVWMDIIKFEMKYGDPNSVSSIYNKALASLNKKSLADSFLSEFTLLNTGATI